MLVGNRSYLGLQVIVSRQVGRVGGGDLLRICEMAKPVSIPVSEEQVEKPKPAPSKEKPQCIVPDCTNKATCRGMCSKCYSAASALVKDSKATWGEMEKLGLALPPKRNTSPNMLKEALLDRRTCKGD